MDKLKMSTPDLTDKNIEQIGMLFPNVITEVEDGTTKDTKGHEIKKYKKVVDFDLLRQMLSKNLVEDDNERYRLDWPGKKASLLKANTPITKTLRPCLEESSGKDGNPGKFDSENLYIEGDNFEVLKILQESYLGKIKMIYIDPPYNTGNDFIYKDNFAMNNDEWRMVSGELDEEGGKLFRNTDSNGRYHSDWLSMMYERLIVARDLLKDDGVIFISIDDNEVHNLRKICDEVFGEENFVSQVVRRSKIGGGADNKQFATEADYIICFARSKEDLGIFYAPRSEDDMKRYKETDEIGPYFWDTYSRSGLAKGIEESLYYEVEFPDGSKKSDRWRRSKERLESDLLCGDAKFVKTRNGWNIHFKQRVSGEGKRPRQILYNDFGNTQGTDDVRDIFKSKYVFEYPKPVQIPFYLSQISTKQDDIILDFFSGSATTAHAVMQLNAEELAEELATKNTNTHEKGEETDSENFRDLSCLSWQKKGKRKFIMVQLPEPCDENSEAFKAGYKTIPEIGKERIRRAAKMINDELLMVNEKAKKKMVNGELSIMNEEGNSLFKDDPNSSFTIHNSQLNTNSQLDTGFRVYKTDSTNMKDVFYHPSDLKQDLLSGLESNIKEDRTPEDLLTQVILDLGLELTLPIETKKILGNTVFIVQTNALVACFDKDIDFNIVDTISDLKPLKVVFKDASFKDDKDRINVEERFKRLSPETKVTVI